MVDTKNQEGRKYNLNDNEDMNNNYWINGILAWWSGFSLRTKLLAIATLVVSLLMTGITFFALNSIQRDAGMNDTFRHLFGYYSTQKKLFLSLDCLLYTSPSPRD